jgi:hypothetical protein
MNNIFEIATVTSVNEETNQVTVNFQDYETENDSPEIPVIVPPVGAGTEGDSSPLGIGDKVLVGFLDVERQNPFVFGKIRNSNNFISGKKIVYKEHEIEFTDDSVVITEKNGTKLTLTDGELSLEHNLAGFTQINLGSLVELVNWLNSHVHVGNLGYPTAPATPPIVPPFDKITIKGV